MSELSPVELLYRDVVLEHYRHPRNREPLAVVDGQAMVDNPVCGDQVRVEVAIAGGRIREISARARGCSIAVAAASVMTELVQGLDRASAGELAQRLEQLVSGAAGALEGPLDERLRAFERVAALPARRRCALLAWEALHDAWPPSRS